MVILGDCRVVCPAYASEHGLVDAVVTDPPYHLLSTVKRFSKCGGGSRTIPVKAHQYQRLSRGFMGQTWDGGDVAFQADTWRAIGEAMKPGAHLVAFGGTRTFHRLAVAIEDAGFELRDTLMWLYGTGFPKSHDAGDGWGTALKPGWEPIALARKPLVGTVAANIAAHGTGAINIDACRVPAAGADRWPANVLHDGSDNVVALFPSASGARAPVTGAEPSASHRNVYNPTGRVASLPIRGDTGSAARFFYSAKATAADRAGTQHPTVKPVALMRWLVRLVTPPGGVVLDPFAGSGSTLVAAQREGFRAVGVEMNEQWHADATRRVTEDLL